ncbi:hypothetical protein [Rhizobium leguminosarum]|uniref:Asp/Glu racemase n=1 Tax=Rhizobium leguminosarum TaxID=384 RepID=A0A7K3VS73_RHILE|nr:hypothetical protein [Rhizobium leguminosarum]NEK18981.1 hypothetical protein [Rhizobium leguminosarum]
MASKTDASVYISRVGKADSSVKCCASPEDLAGLTEMVDQAAELLVPEDALDVVAYACTSGTAISGLRSVEAKVRAVRPGVAVTTPLNAVCKAFAQHEIRKISAVMPYRREISNLVAKFLKAEGIETIRLGFFGLESDSDMGRLSLDCLTEAVLEVDTPDSEAIFLSCTALRTADLIQQLEDRIGKMVVTSNQAMFWHCLRLAGNRQEIQGFGRLMQS